jgi:TolB-like protein
LTIRLFWVLILWLLPGTAAAEPAPAVAVLYFKNQGNPELEVLKIGLAQMLSSDLQGTPGVRIVSRLDMQEALTELELGRAGITDPITAARIGKIIGVRWLLIGGYFEFAGTLRIDARLIEVETTLQVHALGVEGTAEGLTRMRQEITASMRAKLSELAAEATGAAPIVAPTPQSATAALVAPNPRAQEAVLHFSEGIMAMDRKDATRARESFQRALDADPNLTDAKAALAALDL